MGGVERSRFWIFRFESEGEEKQGEVEEESRRKLHVEARARNIISSLSQAVET